MTRSIPVPRRGIAPAIVAAVLLAATLIGAGATGRLSLPGLGSGGAAQPASDTTGDARGAAGAPGAPPAGDGSGSGKSGGEDAANPDRQIIYTGSLSVRVDDLDKTGSAADTLVSSFGGRVEQRTRTSGDQVVCPYVDGKYAPTDGSSIYPYPCTTGGATLTVVYRIPAARFTEAVVALERLGTVLASNTNSSDVTAQVRDLDATIRNLQATETALLAIMEKAATVPDILAVQQQLTDVRGRIEQAQAQAKALKAQAAEGTLQVSLSLPTKPIQTQSEGWKLQDQVDAALAGLIAVGQMTATGLVWLGIVGLPILVVLAILLVALARVRRIVRPARPAPSAPADRPAA